MIILKILGILFLIVLILLFCPIILKISNVGENTDFTLRFFLFTFKNIGKDKKNKKEKIKKPNKKNKKNLKKDTEIDVPDKKEKYDVKKLLKLTLYAINSGSKAFIKLAKGVKIYDVEVYFIVASTNAYKTAMKFAKVEGAFHTNLAVLKNVFKIELKNIIIEPNFVNENELYDYKLKIKLKPITMLLCLIYFLFTFGFKFLKDNKNTLKDEKQEVKNEQQ